MIHHFRVVAMTLAIGLAATSARAQEDTGNVALGKHAAVIEPELGQVVAAPEVVDGDLQTPWVSHFETINQSFEIDLGDAKRVWRVVIHWAPDRFTPAYDIIADREDTYETDCRRSPLVVAPRRDRRVRGGSPGRSPQRRAPWENDHGDADRRRAA